VSSVQDFGDGGEAWGSEIRAQVDCGPIACSFLLLLHVKDRIFGSHWPRMYGTVVYPPSTRVLEYRVGGSEHPLLPVLFDCLLKIAIVYDNTVPVLCSFKV